MSQSPSPDRELDVLERAERARRVRALKVIAASLGVGALVVALGLTLGGQDAAQSVAHGEQAVLLKTNDPQCRGLIEGVEALSAEFKRVEPTLGEALLDADPSKVTQAQAQLATLRERLEALRALSLEANLRYKDSQQELKAWFEHVNGELDALAKASARHAALQAPQADPSSPEPHDPATARAKQLKDSPPKTPEQSRDAAVLTIYEAFKAFRVWHTATMHPCGEASPQEQPWEPGRAGEVTP